MILRGMRWGYDGGGMACGPTEGSLNTEVIVQDDLGHLHFVLNGQCLGCGKIMIAPFSLFDTFMLFNCEDLDQDYLYEKANGICTETYDFEEFDYPEEMMHSKFLDAIKFSFKASAAFEYTDEDWDKSARDFFKEFQDRDLSTIKDLDLPRDEDEMEDEE